MAYNASNEERTVLAEIEKGTKGDKIIISKIKNIKTNNESIDIRLFYTNKEGELQATAKGVRFSTDVTNDVITALQKAIAADSNTDAENAVE